MPLTGQAKTDYQREYMRSCRVKIKENRSNIRLVRPAPVRPEAVRPQVKDVRPKPVQQQSHSPMMVGYVPPESAQACAGGHK